MREADLDSALALMQPMAADLRSVPHIEFLSAYYKADLVERARLLNEFAKRPGPAPIVAALVAMRVYSDFALAEQLLNAHNSPNVQVRATNQAMAGLTDVARGRWSSAMARFRAAQELDANRARYTLMQCLQLPLIHIPDPDLRTIRTMFQRADSVVPPQADPYAYEQVGPHYRLFALALVDTRLGELAGARAYADQLAKLPVSEPYAAHVKALQQALRARLLMADSNWGQALQQHERVVLHTPPDLASSPLDGERYIRAELLLQAGRADEALRWLEHAFEFEWAFIYNGPRALRRAQAYDARGDRDQAAQWYARFLELWANADSANARVVRDAQARSAAVLRQPR